MTTTTATFHGNPVTIVRYYGRDNAMVRFEDGHENGVKVWALRDVTEAPA